LGTLLILLAILPPLLWVGWTRYEAWKAEQARQKAADRRQMFNFYIEITR
jgi:predicted negative regulator of RcsB-dependent stress response